jgi:hypothetical protein
VRDRSDAADDVPARIASLLACGGGGTARVLDALAGVAALYDELATVQDPAYRSDWSGLDALLARARAAVA